MAKVIGPALFIAANVVSGGAFAWAAPWLVGAGVAVSYYQQRSAAKKAARAARDAYNAGLSDRMQMVDLRPDAPRTLALGRVRAVEGIRRRWVSGTNSEKLTLIVSFAGHEIDAFETFWFNDTPLTLDGSGYVQTSPYLKGGKESYQTSGTLDSSGSASVTLAGGPVSGTLSAVWSQGSGETTVQGTLTVSGSGVSYTLTGGPPGVAYYVTYQVTTGTATARIRTYLGTSAQNVGAALASEYPGKITSTDKFAGIALAVVDLDYDPDVFPQGIPNITATFRGAKVLDPRTGTTAWSENPALHAYHYARLATGWAVPAGEIRTQDVIDAANFCDTSTVFTLTGGASGSVTLPRYRCGIVIASDADPRSSMDEIMETMAGRWGWAGGTLRMRCGRMASSVFTMDESWIAQRVDASGQPEQGSVVRITNGVPREAKVNRVTGRCVDPDQRYQVLPFPAVQDAVLIAADGAEYATEVEYQGVNHIAHAQHLAKIRIREGQAPLRVDASCNLSAYRLELFDVGTVTLPRYGFSAKTFEVASYRWHPTIGVQVVLQEITSDIYDTAPLTGRDPAPNGDLPPPWSVAVITGVTVASGTVALTDGSILTRTHISWTAPISQAVLVGGQIEVQYIEASSTLTSDDWSSWTEPGSATMAVIPGLLTGRYYTFRVRAINSFGVRGPWSAQVSHKISDAPPSGAQPLLRLRATALTFTYDGAGAASPSSQTITLTAELTNLTGTAAFTATGYNSSGVSIGSITLGGSGNVRTMTVAAFGAAAYVVVGISLSTYQDGVTIVRVSNGAGGANSAIVPLFQRTGSSTPVPSTPGSTLTYTFATGTLTGTLGAWSQTVPASGGGYLWTTQALATASATTDTIAPGDWSTARLLATDGVGTPGTNGSSAVRAYALYTGNPVVSGSPVVTSGTSLPSAAAWSPSAATAWSSNTQTPSTNQSMFQTDGTYNPATNQTTWQVPYLSNFKVGNLAAISANLGTITAGTLDIDGYIKAVGNSSLSIPDFGSGSPSISRTVCVIGNTSLGAAVGVYGASSSSTAASGGAGVRGDNTNAGGVGVVGNAVWRGLAGYASASGGASVYGFTNSIAGTYAGHFVHTAGGTALRVEGATQHVGTTTFSGAVTFDASSAATHAARMTSTHTATAPLVLPSVSSFPAPVVGGIVAHSAFGLCVSDGANWYGASALTLRG